MTANPCPCAQNKDRASYHRSRRLPMCHDALEYERAEGRRKYAARKARDGHTVTPRGWVPGSPIEVDEVDPL